MDKAVTIYDVDGNVLWEPDNSKYIVHIPKHGLYFKMWGTKNQDVDSFSKDKKKAKQFSKTTAQRYIEKYSDKGAELVKVQ